MKALLEQETRALWLGTFGLGQRKNLLIGQRHGFDFHGGLRISKSLGFCHYITENGFPAIFEKNFLHFSKNVL